MRHKIFTLISLIFVLRAHPFSIPMEQEAAAQKIMTCVLNCEFDEAFRLSDSLQTAIPNEPFPSLLRLAAIGMRDVDFDRTLDSAGFLSAYQKTIDQIMVFEKANGVSSYSRTMEGLSKAIHAAFYLRVKSYISAMQNGFDALKLLKEAKELDSTNTDVDFFLGMYDYARSELRSRLWWVLFWYPGDKKEGIRKLVQCSKTARMTGTAAKLSLSDIYTKEGKPEKSVLIVEDLEKMYPQSRFVWWAKAKYYESVKKYTEAGLMYEKLSLAYAQVPGGEYNSLVTKNRLAHMLTFAGEDEQAAEVCRAILEERIIDENRQIKRDTKRLLERQ